MSLTSNISSSSAAYNALIPGGQISAPASQAPSPLTPAVQSLLLKSAIGHAAVLSDTPEKWAATLDLLRRHGIDPAGYEDFEKGRSLAITASGVAPLPGGSDEL